MLFFKNITPLIKSIKDLKSKMLYYKKKIAIVCEI